MGRPFTENHAGDQKFSSIPLTIAVFASVCLLVALCMKHTRRAQKMFTSKKTHPKVASDSSSILESESEFGRNDEVGEEEVGLWRKAILMGEKCEPINFSGAILYDYDGKRVSEIPKSPKANSMIPVRGITFDYSEEK